jgi:hypothetical protein
VHRQLVSLIFYVNFVFVDIRQLFIFLDFLFCYYSLQKCKYTEQTRTGNFAFSSSYQIKLSWDVKFSQRCLCGVLSSGVLRHAILWMPTDAELYRLATFRPSFQVFLPQGLVVPVDTVFLNCFIDASCSEFCPDIFSSFAICHSAHCGRSKESQFRLHSSRVLFHYVWRSGPYTIIFVFTVVENFSEFSTWQE